MQRTRSVVGLSALGLVAQLASACGDVAYDRGGGQSPRSAGCTSTAGGEQGTPDELSELLAEVIAPRICQQVVGSFIGLPGEQSHEGPAAGLDPSVGRWWIRQCEAHVVDGRIQVAFGGAGWSWIDRESMGFRVRQYLRFDAGATFTASLHVGYDRRTRVATVWLRPAPGVTAQVRPQGLVRAEATGVFSSVLGGILDLTGGSASARAASQAAEEGSQRLRDRLATGFTVTYSLANEQMDFMLGQLPRGQVPERPWPGTETAWLINERAAVWPSGLDIIGALPAGSGPMTLDVHLEEGQGAAIRRVCADELQRWLDDAWSGRGAGSTPGRPIAELSSPGATRSVQLETLQCRSLLLITPGAQASIPAMLRYRATPLAATAGGSGTERPVGPAPQYGTSSTVVTNTAPSVRIEVRSVSVTAQTPSGGTWDVVGGDPDPYVVVTSPGRRREIDRSPVIDNTREARFDRVLPAAVPLGDFPLRFLVYDEDVTSDELIGVADVDAAAVRAGTVDLVLPLRSEGATPATMGTLRVRFSPVQ